MADFDLVGHFSDESRAREFLEKRRWRDKAVCPHCGLVGKSYRLRATKTGTTHVRDGLWKCAGCRKEFTVTIGTMFEGSHIPLRKWLFAYHLLCDSQRKVSVLYIHRKLGITYKSAWLMVRRIRHSMAQEPLFYEVQDERAAVRGEIFTDLAGIVLSPTVTALSERGVLRLFEHPKGSVSFDEISNHTRANRGYLRVALRLLSSIGWLKEQNDRNEGAQLFALTPKGKAAAKLASTLYSEATAFMPKAMDLSDYLSTDCEGRVLPALQELVQKARERRRLRLREDPTTRDVMDEARGHMEGMLVGPAMVALARGGVLARLMQSPVKADSIPGSPAILHCVFDLLSSRGWVSAKGGLVGMTPRGLYAAHIASAYGVTISYLPTLNNLSILLFGNPHVPRIDINGAELLVNRSMNVWASGSAHKTYFKEVNEIILNIFNRPLAQQPKGICDMGCGDGSFLEYLYSVVKNYTTRGAALDTHPLILVGVDCNRVACRVTKQTLRRAGIPNFYVIQGNIIRPAQLAEDFEQLGLDIHEFFHVRSFLDHNRPYYLPANYLSGARTGRSTAVFSRLGEEILAEHLEENLVRHLRRWAPYTARFGLLILESHTLPPTLAAANLKKTPVVAYDGTHGYSDQYLVELPVFLDCAREAGLEADTRYQKAFPSSGLATVSINLFRTPGC